VNDRGARPFIVSVSSSSKKSGKSMVASFLVRELGAEFGLKVSSGGHESAPVVSDPRIITRPGTDTAALVKAGASKVVWVNSTAECLADELPGALELFPPRGILVVEGNSALKYMRADFAVFVMTVPFDQFKASAGVALGKADLVLVDMRGKLSDMPRELILKELGRLAPHAGCVFLESKEGIADALNEVLLKARSVIEKNT
jgi:molybdopterin-guanine dinucleotide biosynthesis protein